MSQGLVLSAHQGAVLLRTAINRRLSGRNARSCVTKRRISAIEKVAKLERRKWKINSILISQLSSMSVCIAELDHHERFLSDEDLRAITAMPV
jgi:hypothetical protein